MFIGLSNTVPSIVNLPGQGVSSSEDYIVKVKPSLDTTTPTSVTIGIRNLGVPYTVDWGDGEITSESNPIPSHVYDSPDNKEYIVKVTPKKDPLLTGPQVTQLDVGSGNTSTVRRTLIDIIQFGINTVIDAGSFMDGCESLGINNNGEITANDLPSVTSSNAGQFAFRNCKNLNTNKFAGLFTAANQGGSAIITTLRACFLGCEKFNGTGCDTWDVSRVSSFLQMFNGALNYNQPLSSWNTASGQDFERMFEDALLWDQDVSLWNISSAGTDSSNGFTNWKRQTVAGTYSPISQDNASKILQGWSEQTLPNAEINLKMIGSTLTAAGETAKENLEGAAEPWTIDL